VNNAISEIARIANDENLPRRRRLGLIREFLSALGNATGSAVAASAASEPKPTTNQQNAGRDDPAQAGERQNTTDGNVIQTNPCIAKGRTEGDEKERTKTQTSKEAPRRPSHNATSQDARDKRRDSFSAFMKREHPEEWRALREARNAVARALYDPERERERKARIRAANPEKWAESALRRSRRRKEAKAAWRAAHPEKVREYARKYAEKRRAEGRGTASAEAWARIVADEARHVAYLAERAAYRRAIKAHKRDYRHQPARMRHEWERLCPAFAPGAHGQSGEAFARELAIERRNEIHERNRK
jgi:hypothetical protein